MRSIVPRGFECTAHKVFFEYLNPLSEISLQNKSSDQRKRKEIIQEMIEKEKKEEILKVEENNGNEKEDCDEILTSTQPPNLLAHPQVAQVAQTLQTPNRTTSYQDVCSICLSSYDNPVTLVYCHHSYCLSCLLLWLSKKQLCPLCKSCGNYFIQSNRYSSSKKDIKILSICANTQQLSSTIVEAAIKIHRKRFPPNQHLQSHPNHHHHHHHHHQQQQNTSNNHPKKENTLKKRKLCSSDPREISSLDRKNRPSDLNTIANMNDREELKRELDLVNQHLHQTIERLQDLDNIIINSQK